MPAYEPVRRSRIAVWHKSPLYSALCFNRMIRERQSGSWSTGDYKPIASIEITDEELEKLTGQKVLWGIEEGLGEWHAVGGLLPSGKQIEIIKYLDSLCPKSYVIRIDRHENTDSVLSEVLTLFGLKCEDLIWNSRET